MHFVCELSAQRLPSLEQRLAETQGHQAVEAALLQQIDHGEIHFQNRPVVAQEQRRGGCRRQYDEGVGPAPEEKETDREHGPQREPNP